jgi:hypothetical protein
MAQKQKDAYNQIKERITAAGGQEGENDGDMPDDEANQLRSKTRLPLICKCREIYVAPNEPHQADLPTR